MKSMVYNVSMLKLKEISSHFKKTDPLMYDLFKATKVEILEKESDSSNYFSRISREIIGQQLSGKVATVISKRFVSLFRGHTPTAEILIKMEDQTLRDVGMAWSKVRAIKDLASKTVSKDLHFGNYSKMEDDEIMKELLKVKGIGPWTVEMFLIFTLGREDIFSIKDLGLKKAICNVYKLNKDSKEIDRKILRISRKWSPYKSYASLALWESLDLDE